MVIVKHNIMRRAGLFIALGLICLAGLAGCLPEDNLIDPVDRGDVRAATVRMGATYANRVYFNLLEGQLVKSIDYSLWDIELACGKGAFDIRLNSARFASVASLSDIAMKDVNDDIIDAAVLAYDVQSGGIDSTAINQWWTFDEDNLMISKRSVFLVDRGYSPDGDSYGQKLLMIESATETEYKLIVADVDGSNQDSYIVGKDARYNYLGLSFDDGSIIEFEPESADWDLVFSKFIYMFRTPEPLPYSVNGALLNAGNAEALVVSDLDFSEIDRSYAKERTLSDRLDAIGYDWKTFSLETSTYTVDSERSYIIRSVDGFLYKLRFTDFYDPENGEKGSPSFEFQRL